MGELSNIRVFEVNMSVTCPKFPISPEIEKWANKVMNVATADVAQAQVAHLVSVSLQTAWAPGGQHGVGKALFKAIIVLEGMPADA